ncbi:MAG TPA: hypothetical protein VGR53_03475 [Nitrososphaerales archaeon]|nr:hypothetical protein [Nitrososphaerales archaeon]
MRLALEELAELDIVETEVVEADFELEVDEGDVVVDEGFPEEVALEEEAVVPIEDTLVPEVPNMTTYPPEAINTITTVVANAEE